jgi:amino-acid N-acetyltransferase
VAETDVKIVGMASLLVMWRDLAEVRSLVISPDCQGQGVGRRLVEMLIEDAQQLEIPRVFALTRKPGFFLKIGFHLTHIEKLPRKVKRDCVFCPKFQACDEAAVELWLRKPPSTTSTRLERPHSGVDSSQLIPLRVK